MVGLVAAIVVTIGLLGPHVTLMNSALVKFTPDLAVLFAVGLLAAGIVTASERTRSRPWAGYALAATVPVIALMVVKGATWSNLNLFWLDLAWAPAIGCLLAAIATSRPRPVVRFLDSRLPRSLGSCSYSLYLTHVPIVIAVSYGLILGRVGPGPARSRATLGPRRVAIVHRLPRRHPRYGAPRRTTRTGQGAVRTTFSATLPSRARPKPLRPSLPITMRSAFVSAAAALISRHTVPLRSAGSASKPRRRTPAMTLSSASRATTSNCLVQSVARTRILGRPVTRNLVGVNYRNPGSELLRKAKGVVESRLRGLAEVMGNQDVADVRCGIHGSRSEQRTGHTQPRLASPRWR